MAIPQAGYYQDYARREANRVGIPEDFALALFDAESSWNPQATSPKNARGIAQFIPETGARYGLITDEDFYNPEKSISAGVRHLKDLYDRYEGNLELVAAGYNAGPGAVDKYGGMPPYKETRNYWDRIQQKMGLTQPVNMDGSAALPSDMPMDPGPNQVHPSYGFEPVQREPTMGERLASDPWLQMGLGILGASGGSGIQNIASGAQQGLANVNKSEAAIRQQQSAAMLRNLQRQRMQQRGNLQNQRIQQAQRAATADPSRIREVRKLVGMGAPLEQSLRMIYPTGTSSGRTLDEKGGVVYEKIVSPSGTTGWSPVEDQEQGRREIVISDEARAKATGSGFGQAAVGAMEDASKSLSGVTTGLSRVERVLDMFESGDLDNKTGPLSGLITPYLGNENVALLELEQMNATLDNLNIANLAPVSNYEIGLVKQMFASPTRNKSQNIAILKELKRSYSAKQRVARETLGRISSGESIESIRANPPELNFEPRLDTEGVTERTSLPAGWSMEAEE